ASTSNMTEFIIIGPFQGTEVQRACFVLFLPIYLATLVSNGLTVLTVSVSECLCSPMYIFLGYLSLVEICYSSTVVPKFIADLLTEIKTISLQGCLAQIFFLHSFLSLLVVMAYDHYMAICRPLHYTNNMIHQLCYMLVAGSWLRGFILVTIALPFCSHNVIDHYFCDLQLFFNGLMSVLSLLILVCSYIVMLVSLRNHSAEGRHKALSIYASHITVVILCYRPATFLYMRGSSTFTRDKLVAVFYSVITPMVNRIIYTLRNAEVKIAMRKLWNTK
uniref:G-protein coupled receptors family 1 profile domain-containing protein n=1 Tax=Cavia porcellus TaxID=10141 RepID=A0A286XVW6_CAVPO